MKIWFLVCLFGSWQINVSSSPTINCMKKEQHPASIRASPDGCPPGYVNIVKERSTKEIGRHYFDCCYFKLYNDSGSGVYTIYPFGLEEKTGVKVFCDMETNGGGWTVFLSRDVNINNVNFTANWHQYKHGFGTPGKEHWLGNEKLYALTPLDTENILRVEYSGYLKNKSVEHPKHVWGEWNTFSVSSEDNEYRLLATDPNQSNVAHDWTFSYHNGMRFSTYDNENDDSSNDDCANYGKGGYWYNKCYSINPTGRHNYSDTTGICVYNWSADLVNELGYAEQLQFKMRSPACVPSDVKG